MTKKTGQNSNIKVYTYIYFYILYYFFHPKLHMLLLLSNYNKVINIVIIIHQKQKGNCFSFMAMGCNVILIWGFLFGIIGDMRIVIYVHVLEASNNAFIRNFVKFEQFNCNIRNEFRLVQISNENQLS